MAEQLDDDGVPVGAPIVPARITLALDAAGLHGPEVDERVGTYEGNPAGDVDAWELGEAVPTREQVRLLAELTGVAVAFFYWPEEPGERDGHMWVCGRSGPNGGGRRVCQQVPTAVVPPAAEDPHRARQHALPVRPRVTGQHGPSPVAGSAP
ncbi:hypothetical protein ACIBTV_27680 [Micromonospora sp. NPDC049366]|uniref:hypothetical protein n=1 Tax=Micromonospora sp. NPDC049366 TaxID=3364271 RepID=UPI00379848B5